MKNMQSVATRFGSGQEFKQIWLVFCAVWAALSVSCGGSRPQQAAETVAKGKEALVCTDATLSWASDFSVPPDQQRCAGPWSYNPYASPCYANFPNPVCGLAGYEQTTCYGSCQSFDFGTDFSKLLDQSVSLAGQTTCTKLCFNLTPPTQAMCQAAANERMTQLGGTSATGTLGARIDQGHSFCHEVVWLAVPRTGSGPECGPGVACDDTTRPIYASCRTPENGLDSDPSACGIATDVTAYSPPGDRSADIPGAAVQCLTCDDLPVATATDVQNKYNCLSNSFYNAGWLPSDQVDTGALFGQIVARLKLLLELKGDLLSEAQRDFIRSMYGNNPATIQCDGVTDFAQPPVDPGCDPGAVNAVLGGIQLCERMIRSYVPGPVAEANDRFCVDVAAQIESLPPQCGQDAFRTEFLGMFLPFVQKALANAIPANQDRRAVIQDRLRVIGHVYPVLQGLNLGQDLWSTNGQVTGALWKGLLGPETDKLRNDPSRLREVFDDEFSIDREVLLAAFTPGPSEGVSCPHLVSETGNPMDASCDPCVNKICQNDSYCCTVWWDDYCAQHDPGEQWCSADPSTFQTPIQSPVLQYVLADALTPLSERLEDVSLVHDLGCRFQADASGQSSCRAGGTVPATATSALWEAISAVPDANQLRTVLSTRTQLDAQWRPVFQAIADQHATLEAAVNADTGSTTYDPAVLAGGSATEPTPAASSLSNILVPAGARVARYAATGLLDTEADLLLGGLNDSRFTAIQSDINGLSTALSGSVSQFNSAQTSLIQTLIADLDNQQSQDLIQNKLDANLATFKQLTEEIVGLRVANDFDDRRFGDFMQSFARLNASDAVDAQTLMRKGSHSMLSIPASLARFLSVQGANYADLNNLALGNGQVWKLSAGTGDIVNFQISGDWTPTCALRTAVAPNGQAYGITDAKTGPDGYTLTASNSSYNASGHTSTDTKEAYASLSASVEACASSPGMAVTGDGVKACIKAEAGVKWDKAHTDSTSKGDESRDTGSFSVGLRVPGTPFQSMPAGSLLLVQTVPGSTSLQDVIDVRVLHAPVSSVLIAQNADLYLVVNDLGGCADTSADALSVTITPMQALASQAKQLTGAMAGVYNSLRQRAALASERGVLTPTEISAMHDEAVAQVTTACNCDFSSYPAPLRELFGTWVNKELVALERQVAMFKDRKSMELAVIERDGLSAELATQAEKRRLQYLLPAWMLRNLDADALRESMRPLLRSLTQELFPFLQLRYPSALVHGSEASSRLSTLLQNTWATATVDLADQVTHTASVLMTEAVTSIRDNPPTKSSDLAVLSFPNPTGTVPAGSIWFQASPESAGASWSAINNDNARTASFQIRPEDLYSAQGGPSILSCTDSAPVITASALFVSLDSEATGQRLSSQNWGVPLKIGGAQSFATAAGVPSFRFPSAWLSQEIPVLFGISGDAVNVFKQFAATTNVAQGLSPFTRFDVDLSALKPLEDQGILSFASDGSGVPEMLMMFQLETRPQGTSVGGVTTCH